jgi:hypothetical protein
MTTSTAVALDDMVARFGERPRCESDSPCTRPAPWLINLHGCEQAIMCGQHKTAWMRRVQANGGRLRCVRCNTEFDCVADSFTVTAI